MYRIEGTINSNTFTYYGTIEPDTDKIIKILEHIRDHKEIGLINIKLYFYNDVCDDLILATDTISDKILFYVYENKEHIGSMRLEETIERIKNNNLKNYHYDYCRIEYDITKVSDDFKDILTIVY